MLGLGLDLARLQTLFSSIPLPDGSVVTLADSAGRVLARSRDAERYIGTAMTDVAGGAARCAPSAHAHRRSTASSGSTATRSSTADRGC